VQELTGFIQPDLTLTLIVSLVIHWVGRLLGLLLYHYGLIFLVSTNVICERKEISDTRIIYIIYSFVSNKDDDDIHTDKDIFTVHTGLEFVSTDPRRDYFSHFDPIFHIGGLTRLPPIRINFLLTVTTKTNFGRFPSKPWYDRSPFWPFFASPDACVHPDLLSSLVLQL